MHNTAGGGVAGRAKVRGRPVGSGLSLAGRAGTIVGEIVVVKNVQVGALRDTLRSRRCDARRRNMSSREMKNEVGNRRPRHRDLPLQQGGSTGVSLSHRRPSRYQWSDQDTQLRPISPARFVNLPKRGIRRGDGKSRAARHKSSPAPRGANYPVSPGRIRVLRNIWVRSLRFLGKSICCSYSISRRAFLNVPVGYFPKTSTPLS